MPAARRTATVFSLIVGVIVMLLGATWKYWHSPETLWSPEQAKEYTTAWRDLKAAATSGVRVPDPAHDPKLVAAQARFDAIKIQLDHARAMNDYTGPAMIAAGAVIIAISARLLLSETSSA